MVRLLFDVHVPLTVAEQLSKRGIDVLTAQADNSATLPDHDLLARATSLDRVIVTSDIRFRALAEHFQAKGQDFAGLIFAHPLQVTIGRMVLDLELLANAVTAVEIRNQVVFLPL